ncbi:MAG TPA: protoporphyrinogen oxidase HemJ [Roseiarcus sp.]|nr:protoporphyrinogen oxidase HemJ [Roseiarcus sp.]
MADLYLWIKALHILAVISFMAGMLYLPRLFVYHASCEPGSPQSETFKIMERRLLRAIINPALVVVWLTGPWLAYQSGYYQSPWLWAKFGLVLVLSGVHGYFARTVKVFAADKNDKSQRFYRFLNEVPTLLMVAVVVLVVVKPF